jgi:two-component system, CAI-1 autoinducer sensor kinase/phosphatase CqsS
LESGPFITRSGNLQDFSPFLNKHSPHMRLLSKFIARVKTSAQEIVDYSEPMIPNIGYIGIVFIFAIYFYFEYLSPQKYNSIIAYLIEFIFAVPKVLYPLLSRKHKSFYHLHFILGGLYIMPFFSFFMLLKNEGSFAWTLVAFGCLLLLILIYYDWLIILLMTIGGISMATIAVYLLDGKITIAHEAWTYIPLFVIFYIGASSVNYRKQMGQEARILLLKSLSGMIAHEMRNPLNAINLAMENIRYTLPSRPHIAIGNPSEVTLSADDLISIHDVISESIETVESGNKIIDSILSNLREGEIDKCYFRRHSVRPLIMYALNNYNYRNPEEKRLIFTDIRSNFDFFGDKDLLIYVLFNLLNNAFYYSQKEDFRIDISTESTLESNILRIRDNGPGIPAALREVIFNQFFTAGKQEGNGLGLSFCRRVVESFSGSITCESIENRWSEFVITLPKYESKAVVALKKQIIATKRVLVVDDQAINRLFHVKFLSELDCATDQAENGKQALDMIEKVRYDMILMDIEMPVLSGDETVKLLRSGFNMTPSMMLHYRDAPVVGVTGLQEEDAVRRTLYVGMNELVLKPLTRDILINLFEKYFFNERNSTTTETTDLINGAKILVADDNFATRKYIGIILENEGGIVTQAKNGKQVLDLLDTTDFDLVLLDMEMPVLSGLEAAKMIRRGEGFSWFRQYGHLPIIAVTGNSDRETIRQVMAAGMNAHIGKPVSKQDLLKTISFWLSHARNYEHEHVEKATAPVVHDHVQPEVIPGGYELNEPVLDKEIIDELESVGGESLILQLFELFRQDIEKHIFEMEDARTINSLDLANKASHSMKGVAANIGARKLHLLAKHINEAIRHGAWPEEQNWLPLVRLVYEESCSAFTDYISGRVHI